MELMASEKPEIKYFKHIEIQHLVHTLPERTLHAGNNPS